MTNQSYKVIVVALNSIGETEAIAIKVPSTFEKMSEEERDYVERLVEEQGYEFLTYFSGYSELASLKNAISEVMPQTCLHVKHWNANEDEANGQVHQPFQMDITDTRSTTGQLYVDLGPVEGNIDDSLQVIVEVNTLPGTDTDVQCLHVAINNMDNLFTLFKRGDDLIMEPNGNTLRMNPVKLCNGRKGYVIDVQD
jgi:hypothetical protein